VLAGRGNILMFTGAGISTESGIPDFRGPDGLWTRMDPDDFTIERYVSNREIRTASWQMRAADDAVNPRPNDAHRAVTALWRRGQMVGCVTQNIDGLHQQAGLPPEALVELHGNAADTLCLGCGLRRPTDEIARRVRQGGGPLRGLRRHLEGRDHPLWRSHSRRGAREGCRDGRRRRRRRGRGSTLSVFPPPGYLEVIAHGYPLVIVNVGPTDLDEVATVVVSRTGRVALPRLVAALGGPAPSHTKYRTTLSSDAEGMRNEYSVHPGFSAPSAG
jgi:NAD-dependent deacetylase